MQLSRAQSLSKRALQALLVTIGFYLLAITVACFLLWVVYAELFLLKRVYFIITIPCLIGVWTIISSLLPPRETFTAPGPQLLAKDHPQLFIELESIAKATKQPMPKEVYLLPDVSAWVGERGGFLGLGRKRIMGLGLPLMELLTLSQFRAVLAHEFGHYHAGDTMLGPWIYRTRAVIGQTIVKFAQRNSSLRKPFIWYGNYFLRVTHAISRQQEFSADRLAAILVGAKSLHDGLRLIHQVAPAFQGYWSNDVAPVLHSGLKPPILQGFQRFLQVETIAQHMQKNLEAELSERTTTPYDTHPSLRERLAALESLPLKETPVHEAQASSLLGNTEELELPLLAAIGNPQVKSLKPVGWEDVGEEVYPKLWQERLKHHRSTLKKFTVGDLSRLCHDLDKIGAALFREGQGQEAPQVQVARSYGLWILGSALAMTLKRQGWQVECLPGQEANLSQGEKHLEPFKIIRELFEGQLKPDDWYSQCQAMNISDIHLE